MACEHLNKLREQATATKNKLQVQRRKARACAHLDRDGHQQGKSDYEPLLLRRLERICRQIEHHLASHHCQD